MPIPTVEEFRSVRLCSEVFARTSDIIIEEGLERSYEEHRIRASKLSTIWGAAHLIARDDDDIMAMDGVATNAVDFGTGGGLMTDEMDGDRRTVYRHAGGVMPGGVPQGDFEDIEWLTTTFGRRMILAERRKAAQTPIMFV